MSVGMRIVHDTGGAGLRSLAKRVAAVKRRVLVGVPAGKIEADGTSLATVAAVNEFGSTDGRVPERSFLRSGIREHMPTLIGQSASLLKRIADGTMGEERALEVVGVSAAAAVKQKIIDGPFEANAPSTVKRKGSDRPLVDSGALRQGITHVVESGGSR